MPIRVATVRAADVPSSQTDFLIYVDLGRVGATALTLAEAESSRWYTDTDLVTQMAREIVSLTEGHGKYASLTSTSKIAIDYDGIRADYAVGDTFGRNNVWTDFRLVAHLQSNGLDSTGALTATDDSTTYTSQKIGNGVDFEGSTPAKITYGSPVLGFTTHLKVSFFMLPESPNANGMVLVKTNWIGASTDSFYIYFVRTTDSTGYFNVFVGNGSSNKYRDFPSFSTTSRDKHDIVYDTTTRIWSHYINAALVHSSPVDTISAINNAASKLIMGETPNPPAGSLPFDGGLDEVRVSGGSTTRTSANWITTEHNNQNREDLFWGTWTTFGGGGFTPTPLMHMRLMAGGMV